uniref:Uncharacterized protein n=1 Tax=Helicotheca tamesis TaxID=374047 RepID=A0A7S2N3G7_9STRA|mmetsp:Transcript_8661/g.11992  ORF Transcript_8661/g.11992 Transcript_8661/m.11992 type:complete len:172 (+) Transcript_8661:145-660(+)
MSGAYRRVSATQPPNTSSPTSPPNTTSTSSTTTTQQQSQKTNAEKISDKIQALGWIIFASLLIHYTNFFSTLFSDPKIIRPVFHAFLILFSINTILTFYLAIYLPKVKKITNAKAWDVYCPRVIPIMTGCGLGCAFCAIRSTWPVWGFLSPAIWGVVFLGGLFLTHFIPWL